MGVAKSAALSVYLERVVKCARQVQATSQQARFMKRTHEKYLRETSPVTWEYDSYCEDCRRIYCKCRREDETEG